MAPDEKSPKGKILIVDDSPDILELLGVTLQGNGYEVLTAENGEEGFEKFEANPDVSMVISDMDMPILNGLGLIKKLRAANYTVPIVILTGRREEATAIQVVQHGADDYIVKDGNIHEEILLHARKVMEMRKISDEIKRLNELLKEVNGQLQSVNDQLDVRNKFIRKTFGRYMSDEVVEKLLESPDGLKLGGEALKVTVIMTDLRGFSAICERFAPEAVVDMLNGYLKEMTDIIFRHGGTINEILGDALLILFGAPTMRPDDADRAIACALEMQLAMAGVNRRNRASGFPELEMGIGINTGMVVAGNLGSDIRAKYAVVGSNVNLAGRVESFTVGGQVLITESTLKSATVEVKTGEQFVVPFKGFKDPVPVYEATGIAGKFDISLPGKRSVFVPLARELAVRFEVLEGKFSSGGKLAGAFTSLSDSGAVLRAERGLRLHSNLTITLEGESPSGRGAPISAKVMKAREETPNTYLMGFTYVPEEVRSFFDGLRRSAPQ